MLTIGSTELHRFLENYVVFTLIYKLWQVHSLGVNHELATKST